MEGAMRLEDDAEETDGGNGSGCSSGSGSGSNRLYLSKH